MKKLLGIIILGLLFSGNAYADSVYNGTFIDALVVKLVDTKDLKAEGFTSESVHSSPR